MPAATTWNVEDALEEVVAEIDAGTFALKLDEPTKAKLKATYRSDFEREHAAGTDWNKEKGKVFVLCRLLGAYAETCSITSASNPAKVMISGHLNQKCVLTAAELVAKFICPSDSSDIVTLGKWCRGLRRRKPGRLGRKLAAAAETLAAHNAETRTGAKGATRKAKKAR